MQKQLEKNEIQEDTKLWRYMDFTKFVSLLDSSSLFFTRSDKFDDPFEGTITKADIKYFQQELEEFKKKEALMQTSDGRISTSDLSGIISALLFGLGKSVTEAFPWIINQIRQYVCINCWHMNEYESDAMWKLYLKSNEGVAIQTTFKGLRSSFEENADNIHIGQVKYVDYEHGSFIDNLLTDQFMHKRISFAHEKEVRAIIHSNQNNSLSKQWTIIGDLFVNFHKDLVEEQDIIPKLAPHSFGTNINLNLHTLIDRVYVSPTAPKWFHDLVVSIMQKYNVQKEVIHSSLSEQPIFL